MMKRILIYVAMLTLSVFSQSGLASLAQAKQRAILFEFAINQARAVDKQPRHNDSTDGKVERAAEGSVEKAAEGSVEKKPN
jgi:hypothetical protein